MLAQGTSLVEETGREPTPALRRSGNSLDNRTDSTQNPDLDPHPVGVIEEV